MCARAGKQIDCGVCAESRVCWETAPDAGDGVFADKRVVLADDEAVFTQGERFRGLFIVVSGYLKLRESRADGTERIVALRGAGDLVGLEGWASNQYQHAAIAVGSARLCFLSAAQNRRGGNSSLLALLLRKASRQLERTSRQWAGLPAIDRVSVFLEDLHATGGVDRGVLDQLPMTRAEIGSHLGLAEETVVRAIARLKARKR